MAAANKIPLARTPKKIEDASGAPAPAVPEPGAQKTPEEAMSIAIIRHSFEGLEHRPRPLARAYLTDLDDLGFQVVPKPDK
jgi:hypothetical protein